MTGFRFLTRTAMQAGGFRHSVSFWLGVALSFVLVLQAIPFVGEIFLFTGGIFLPSVLTHALLLALLVESMTGYIPRVWVAVPMLAYGAYYTVLFADSWKIRAMTREAADSQPALAFHFDPSKQSLVIADARSFVAEYDVPVAYEVEKKAVQEGYIAYRLLTPEQCETLRTTRAMPGLSRVLPRDENHPQDNSGCVFATPERPPFGIVTATKLGIDAMWSKQGPGIIETGVDIARDGRTIGRYRTGGYAWLQPMFPWFFWFGCARLPIAPSYGESPTCGLEFIRELTRFGRADDMKDDALFFRVAAAMLGIAPAHAPGDRRETKPDDGFDALLAKLPERVQTPPIAVDGPRQIQGGDEFDAFAAFLQSDDYTIDQHGAWKMLVVDGAEEPPQELREAVLRDPVQLVPYRGRMIAKLAALQRHDVQPASQWVQLLQRALASLPKETFATMPDDELNSLLQYFAAIGAWRDDGLYPSTGAAGKRALSFYEKELAQHGGAPYNARHIVTALCRIGEADDATRKALRALYLKSLPRGPKPPWRDDIKVNSLYFVTLLAMGEGQFLLDNPMEGADAMTSEWRRLLIDGKGRVDARPNNCAPFDKYSHEWSRRSVRPGLAWTGEQWIDLAQ